MRFHNPIPKVDGDREDYIPGQIQRLDLGMEVRDDMGLRSFNGIEAFQGYADDDWGMTVKWPDWIDEAHNTQKGRIFICGSGPSLYKQVDLLKELKDQHTWTVNRIRRWKELPFIPTYHSIAEPGPVAMQGRRIFGLYDFPEAHNRIAINWWPVTAPGWLWCPKAPDDIQLRWEGTQGMEKRLAPLPTAWASPLTVTQLALWMGYTEIVLLGVDTTQTGQAWDVKAGRTAEPRNIRSILECADRLRRDIQREGRIIWDATPGGRLNTEGSLPYRELAEIL